MKAAIVGAVVVFGFTFCAAQEQALPPQEPWTSVREFNQRLLGAAPSRAEPAWRAHQDYRIGAEDLIDISVFEVPELSRTARVSASGEVSLPLIGLVKAAGLSPIQLERVLSELLRRSYVKDPQVTVFLKEFRSDPVSVVGAVKMPGLYYIRTRKSLLEVLAMAQGLSEGLHRHPGRTVLITRSSSPQASAGSGPAIVTNDTSSAVGEASSGGTAGVVEVPLKELLNSGDPQWNVPVYPGDVVKVPPAGTVYVAGDVRSPGGFPLTDFDNISVIQALAMAGGPTKSAKSNNAVIIRRDALGNRTEDRIHLGRVLKGTEPDVMLGANNILFIPGSVAKKAALRGIEMAISAATGILIWSRY